ncbi:MAG: M1 family metallopeptidase [Bacteroidia bacterium]|nr:M1 family metallopeptidase [Bacteroidia bacterium]NND10157.1 M1 family metallopeptidase [Flavobacteriaceae bacterium]MBT8309410.1 M1 family metallopeptidase [Bacteroidia bacterium]NNK28422.1 M1 family metallopeptidase [Flavobacteriaceae bacterium]NNL61608.1 M1 family metallopeptidase [Flavobacteriaceae bacterium]
MKTLKYAVLSILFVSFTGFAQEAEKEERELGHTNTNKFKQLYDEFSTPNMYRTASGAPGPAYYQQQADYKMDLELDDKNSKLSGYETITYTNNSPDTLEYLWVQLDQNMRAKDSKTPLIQNDGLQPAMQPGGFANNYLSDGFDGGFNIEAVKDANGKSLPHMINRTMMRVEMPKPLASGEKFSFSIKWWYNINDHVNGRGRSGYEFFPEDGNKAYVIAQFYPRMAVYSDVEGWQNSQFWGRDEFALPFGNFEVNITVPADHILDGTGKLMNRKEVFSKEMMKRYNQAKKSYDEPVIIVNQAEAEEAETGFSDKKKTWKLYAENVRDFGFATSRKFIWDMMAVKVGNQDVMAVSMYPKEGNPLWELWSTKAVASTLKSYSRMTFDYPYHKAISVHAKNQGMEYPMICWNYGRPDKEGNYSDRTKYGMISVIIHEVGHNYFPMIVNSDERQWTWMDEGLNTFVQYVAEQDFGEWYPAALSPADKKYPSRRGPASKIVPYMGGDQDYIAPIMTKGLNTYQFGNNAYGKPATGLNILRETIMGRELFDYAFKTYSQRWMFKHPTPEDFFRTMEDASAVDLDWFWRGWFYTTDYTDIGLKEVKKYYVSNEPNQYVKDIVQQRGMQMSDLPPLVYMVEEGSEDFKESMRNANLMESVPTLKEYIMDNFSEEERSTMKEPKYFYKVTFEKPGGLVMPIIAEYEYADGSKERVTYPAQIWRLNDNEVSKTIASEKELVSIKVDPDLETADIDLSNNAWPKEIKQSKFDQFKNEVKNR